MEVFGNLQGEKCRTGGCGWLVVVVAKEQKVQHCWLGE